MGSEILSVTFEVDAQSWTDGRFAVPAKVCHALELRYGAPIHLIIESLEGECLFEGDTRMRNGREIFGKGMSKIIEAGQRIRVTASRAKRD